MRRKFTRDLKAHQHEILMDLIGKSPKPVKADPEDDSHRPILAPYAKASRKLRAHYHGKTIHARVRRDGLIRYAGKLYRSPSGAGAAVRQRPTNGWGFWEVERARGDWVSLDELRK